MKAIILKSPGAPDHLVLTELPEPLIKPGEVEVAVQAISINPVDVKTRAGSGQYGRLKEEDPLILGWDICGTIRESKSELFSKGDAVFGMVSFPGHGKAYAQFVAAPAAHLAIKPANVEEHEAAATTLAALTAWQAFVTHAKVKEGDRVLIHAASGGVGHFAVQIAKYLGAYVIGTSSATNRDFVLSIGADEHIDYKTQDFEKQVQGLDFVLDTLGGEMIDRSLEVIRPGGTLISIPSGLNEKVTEKSRMKNINGYPMVVHSSGADMQSLATLLEKGILKPNVSKIFDFDAMPEAHMQIESGRTVGKITVAV